MIRFDMGRSVHSQPYPFSSLSILILKLLVSITLLIILIHPRSFSSLSSTLLILSIKGTVDVFQVTIDLMIHNGTLSKTYSVLYDNFSYISRRKKCAA